MDKYSEFIRNGKEMSRRYESRVGIRDYDPTKVMELEEYLDLIINYTEDWTKTIENNAPDIVGYTNEIKQLRSGTGGALARYLFSGDYSDEEKRKNINELFSRQQDMIFMQQNRDTTCAFLTRTFPAHWHSNNYFDIKYVMDGEGIFSFRNETLHLKKGDVLIVPPDIEHGEASGENSLVVTCAIRKSVFTKIFFNLFEENSLLHSFFSGILRGSGTINYVLFQDDPNQFDEELLRFFIDLYLEQESDLPYSNKMTDNIVGRIFLQLLRHHENRLVLPADSNLYWKSEYGAIFSYINAHYRTVSLAELEKEFHYSRRQLIRIIENCTGQTLGSLLIHMKMTYAAEMLTDSSLPVEEIAVLAGYENFSSFCRAFKKYYGVTPSGYREKMGIP